MSIKSININISGLWLIMWLVTVGFAKLAGWQLLWSAIGGWPYYLGVALANR